MTHIGSIRATTILTLFPSKTLDRRRSSIPAPGGRRKPPARVTWPGRLDGLLAGLENQSARAGTITRLALIEVEAMLWAAGTPLPRELLVRDLADAPASTDLEVLQQARWAVRRLEGRGRLDDLRDFLALRRTDHGHDADRDLLRPGGDLFDDAAAGFWQMLRQMEGRHDVTRAAVAHRLWRLADLSRPGEVLEPACWSARAMADGCDTLIFVPMGQAGRRVWSTGGDPAAYLANWCGALRDGCVEAGHLVTRLTAWRGRARSAAARMKGENALKVIEALAAMPVASPAGIATAAGISRDTAERLLARWAGLGMVREITGGARFQLWAAML